MNHVHYTDQWRSFFLFWLNCLHCAVKAVVSSDWSYGIASPQKSDWMWCDVQGTLTKGFAYIIRNRYDLAENLSAVTSPHLNDACLSQDDVLISDSFQVSFEWSAVVFIVSSGHVCRQVVGRRSQVQTPTLLTLPVSSSSNTHLLFSFLLSNKMSKMSQLSLLLLPIVQYTRDYLFHLRDAGV